MASFDLSELKIIADKNQGSNIIVFLNAIGEVVETIDTALGQRPSIMTLVQAKAAVVSKLVYNKVLETQEARKCQKKKLEK